MNPRGPGQAAVLPSPDWQPATRCEGSVVFFVSEDGTQRRRAIFSGLPVAQAVQEEFAQIVAAGSGPSGSWKRAATLSQARSVAMKMSRWIAAAHPRLETLAQLGRADGRLMARTFTEGRQLDHARALVGYGTGRFSDEFVDEFSRHRVQRSDPSPAQPYTDAELARITTAARGIIRQTRQRIWSHRQLVADYRAGLVADADRLLLGEALDYCARHHDFPRNPGTGWPTMVQRRAIRLSGGMPLLALLHPTSRDMWAFAVLLAAQTGLNRSVLENLRITHTLASAPHQPGVAIIDTYKLRRGKRSRGTLPLAAYPAELVEVAAPAAVPDSSLNSPFGVFSLLADLTRDTRKVLGTDLAFVQHGKHPGSPFFAGIAPAGSFRPAWIEAWWNDDAASQALLAITFPRLRKTRILRSKRPIDHTPATYTRYLTRMRPAIEDGFAVVRDALRSEVDSALAHRQMKVIHQPEPGQDAGPATDTVLGSCLDINHSPLDDGHACRHDFLSCLSCPNARALPRHLPMQLAVADRLSTLRGQLSVEDWTQRHAGHLAQLEEVLNSYTAAQRKQARTEITPDHIRIVTHLFTGALDAT